MANPRRTSYSNSNSNNIISTTTDSLNSPSSSSSISPLLRFLKRPLAFPFLLSVFLLLTWVSLRLQNSSRFLSQSHHSNNKWKQVDDDDKVNLVRFKSSLPSLILKDKRGWLLNPVKVAHDSDIKGGALSCVSVHIGEIRPGGMRGNHRHHTCNETFVIWGAKMKFRLENHEVDKGFAEAIVNEDEVAVVASPSGTAHALVNLDSVRTTFFFGCQDSIENYNGSTTDFKVWKDL